MTCPHFEGTVVGSALLEPVVAPHTWCPRCGVWVRRDPPAEEAPADAT